MYIVYGIGVEVYKYFKYDLDIKDIIPVDQEIVGYTDFNSNDSESTNWYMYYDRLKGSNFIKPDSNTINVKFNDLLGALNDKPSWGGDGKYKIFIVTKVSKSIACNGEMHTWNNTVNVTATTIEKNSQTLKSNDSTSVTHQEMMFSAPTGNELSIKKRYTSTGYRRGSQSVDGVLNVLLNNE